VEGLLNALTLRHSASDPTHKGSKATYIVCCP
jgi:hypothetical protein